MFNHLFNPKIERKRTIAIRNPGFKKTQKRINKNIYIKITRKIKKYFTENLVRNLNIYPVNGGNNCLDVCSIRYVYAGECVSSYSDGSCGDVV